MQVAISAVSVSSQQASWEDIALPDKNVMVTLLWGNNKYNQRFIPLHYSYINLPKNTMPNCKIMHKLKTFYSVNIWIAIQLVRCN